MSNQEPGSEENSTFSNDNISLIVTKKPHCEVKFDITVNSNATEAAYLKAIKTLNKEVSIPGFRKGKAPVQLIIDKFKPSIEKEFVDVVLQTGFNEAIQLSQIHPLKDGEIKRPVVKECNREKGAHFIIEFESRPLIPSVRVEDLKIKKIKVNPITDLERENALQQVVLQFTTYEPIQDRAVQEDDFIDLTVTMLEDPPRDVIKNQRTQVNSTGLPAWMRQRVIGLQAEESVEGMTEQDPTLAEPNPDFRPFPCRVTVNAIWQGNCPAVDDELAKKVGLQSLEELRQKIDERLEQDILEEFYRKQVNAIEDVLFAEYPLDLPQSYIDTNKETRLENYLNSLGEEKDSLTDQDFKQIEQMIERSTIDHLHLYFLLRKIAADYHIQVNQDDLSQELARQVALLPRGRSALNLSGDKKEIQSQVYHLALDRKIQQFLVDHSSSED